MNSEQEKLDSNMRLHRIAAACFSSLFLLCATYLHFGQAESGAALAFAILGLVLGATAMFFPRDCSWLMGVIMGS